MLDQYNKVLVTGGAGFIGSHLVDALFALNKDVVVLDNLSTGLQKNIPSKVKLMKGDIRNIDQIKPAMEDIDLVFHAAANANGTVSVENPRFDFDVNATGTLNTLEAALKAKVKKFVYISSAAVYGKPRYSPIDEGHPTELYIPYGGAKHVGEVYCYVYLRAYDLQTVIARPFCVYGPRENPKWAMVETTRYLSWHLNKKPIQIVGDIDKKIRDFVHVEDLVQGLILIAEKGEPGEVFNIGSGEATSMKKLVDTIGQETGRNPTIEIISLSNDTYSLTADILKLESIGYKPKVSLAEGVKKLVLELGDKPELPSVETIFKKGQKAEKSLS